MPETKKIVLQKIAFFEPEEIAKLPLLESPYNIVDFEVEKIYDFAVTRWTLGRAIIHPRYAFAPAEKEIPMLRLFLNVEKSTIKYPYVDITSKHLISNILPYLQELDYTKYIICVMFTGAGPAKRPSVWALPLT